MGRYIKHVFCVIAAIACFYTPDAFAQQGSDFLRDSELYLRANYYGRYRSTQNDRNEIKVNVLALAVDYKSGYALGMFGVDASAYTNFGHGKGMSELLDYRGGGADDPRVDKHDEPISSINIIAGKFKLEDAGYKLFVRAGLTPLDVGTIGTSGGLHSHSYRGAELKLEYMDLQIGYAIADKFNPEWKRGSRDMETDEGDIEFIHTAGIRYEFGDEDKAFFDGGVGQGWDYRNNAQAVLCYPVREGNNVMTFTGYGFWGKYYGDKSHGSDNEYHLGISADLDYEKTLMVKVGYSYTWAPDSAEMNFRLTPWGQSDNRNFIRTAAQLDDFVWHNESVVKGNLDINLDRYLDFKGLMVGVGYWRGWNIENGRGQTTSWELDYYAYYEIPEGKLKGLNFGVYMAHLRFNDFYGKQDRNDIKGIVGYTYRLF